jgi:hypothetical protein
MPARFWAKIPPGAIGRPCFRAAPDAPAGDRNSPKEITMKANRHPSKALGFLFVLLLTLLPASPLMAGMLDTGALLHAANADAERALLLQRLGSGDVRDTLTRMGVDAADAEARVARLTDAEVADLNARLDQLPAGAGTLEVVLIVFLIFVITDAIGITNIFAFVRPAP